MDQGLWFVMFADSAANLEAAATFLRKAAADWEVTVREGESMGRRSCWVEVLHEGQKVAVGLNDTPSVLEESCEIAEQFGVGRDDQLRIASCDRRFEISYTLQADMKSFNTVCRVEHLLRLYVGPGSVTFSPWDALFV